MSELAYVTIDEELHIATLHLNRPKAMNALDVPTAAACHQAIRGLADRNDLRAIVLRGDGKAFMAGGDVASFAKDFDAAADVINAMLDELDPVVKFIHSTSTPVIACVHGAVAGAGISIMAACDLVFAAEGTRFVFAYDKIGGVPDCGGTYFLPQQIGAKRAAEFMLLGDTWNCEQALSFGLINRILPSDGFIEESEALVKRIAKGPTCSYRAYKQLASMGPTNSLQQQLDAERAAFSLATKTEDFLSGVSAFLKKEKADYKGR